LKEAVDAVSQEWWKIVTKYYKDESKQLYHETSVGKKA
jgi:hypothetical protein